MTEPLQVLVQGEAAGTLLREQEKSVFRYAATAAPEAFVSLTMPVRVRDYVHERLLPIFEMHLPEGYLLAQIKRHFAKLVETDDLGLLRLLAGSVRGRLHYDTGVDVVTSFNLDNLLHSNAPNLFDELVQRFALHSPLSGVQPKVLARVLNKATLKLDDYIVKAWGVEYPQLALNEFWCMTAVQEAGIPVPEFYRSDDAALFIMKRFDLLDNGSVLGFEDMCVLQARRRDDKYVGSYEQVAKSIALFVSAALKHTSLQQFFKMMVMNNHLQNGDAHLKNFGIVYENSEKVWLAPAYDVVSTTAYITTDMAALTLMGSRKWWPRKDLLRFGVNACGLTLKQANALYDECMAALRKTAQAVEQELNQVVANDQRQVLAHLLRLMRA